MSLSYRKTSNQPIARFFNTSKFQLECSIYAIDGGLFIFVHRNYDALLAVNHRGMNLVCLFRLYMKHHIIIAGFCHVVVDFFLLLDKLIGAFQKLGAFLRQLLVSDHKLVLHFLLFQADFVLEEGFGIDDIFCDWRFVAKGFVYGFFDAGSFFFRHIAFF